MVAILEMPSRLRLAPADNERRIFTRKEDNRQITARRLDHSVDARRRPDLSLAMRDLSLGGVGAISDVPVEMGERIAVFVSGNDRSGSWHMQGRVVRCEPSGMGYRLGVAFDAMPAAA
jgi:hypothetical protein